MDVIPTEIEYEGRRYRLVRDNDPLPILDGVSKPYPAHHTGTPLPPMPTTISGPIMTSGTHYSTDAGPYFN